MLAIFLSAFFSIRLLARNWADGFKQNAFCQAGFARQSRFKKEKAFPLSLKISSHKNS